MRSGSSLDFLRRSNGSCLNDPLAPHLDCPRRRRSGLVGRHDANAAFSVATSIVKRQRHRLSLTPPVVSGATFVTGGATITLGDSTTTAVVNAFPTESVTLTGSFTPASATAITITELITVTNNGVVGTFTETTAYTLSADGLFRTPGMV